MKRVTVLVLGMGMLCSCAHETPRVEPLARPPVAAGEERMLSDLVQLTSGFDKAGEAYFSPDMKFIIFQATPKGEEHYQMYLAALEWRHGGIVGAGTPVRISPEPSRNTCGFFSPDGKSLIFASTYGKEEAGEPESGYQRKGGSYRWEYPKGMEIYRCDGRLKKFKSAAGGKVNLAEHELTENEAYDAEGAYSPDGKWIVFTSNRTGDLELYVMRPDGTDVTRLTFTPGYDGGAFFSPDGKRMVYRSDRKGNDLLQIFTADLVFDARGKITGLANERQLTNDENVNWGPYWYPDGKHIIYATSAQGHQNYELYLMGEDGKHKTRVTYWNGFDGLPVFSPDGKWLMWTSKRSVDGTSEIFAGRFRMGPDGEGREKGLRE